GECRTPGANGDEGAGSKGGTGARRTCALTAGAAGLAGQRGLGAAAPILKPDLGASDFRGLEVHLPRPLRGQRERP
ncbi:unnamed protein product, partial [Amoebophrya sp. A120]